MVNDELDPRLERDFQVLANTAERDPQAAAAGRARFLEQAREMKAQMNSAAAVSHSPKVRHIGWNIFIPRKELKQMSILTTIVLIVSLLVGGTGATVVAAQGSEPNDALYSVKLASEDLRYALATREEARLELALAYADNRAEEIGAAVQAGEPLPEPVLARYEEHLQTALRLAAGMQDEEMDQALVRIQARVQAQILRVDQTDATGQEPILQRVRAMLQTQTDLVEDGLTEPQLFREQLRAGQDDDGPGGPGNPWTTGTPTPGSEYGPGDCTMTAPVGDGPGNPWTTGTPTPGSGYGPGPGPQLTTTTNPPTGMNHGDPTNGQNGNNGGDNGGDNGGTNGGGGDGGGGNGGGGGN